MTLRYCQIHHIQEKNSDRYLSVMRRIYMSYNINEIPIKMIAREVLATKNMYIDWLSQVKPRSYTAMDADVNAILKVVDYVASQLHLESNGYKGGMIQ